MGARRGSRQRGIRITSSGHSMLLGHHRMYCRACDEPKNREQGGCERMRKLQADYQAALNVEARR